jgi:transposase
MDGNHVGIDVSKDRLDVHVLPTGEAFWVSNGVGVEDLVGQLVGLSSVVGLEATGGLERLVVGAFGRRWPSGCLGPGAGASLRQCTGQAGQGRPCCHRLRHRDQAATAAVARYRTETLAELVVRRRQVVQMIVAEENRAHTTAAKQAQKSIQRLLVALRRELASLDADMDDHIHTSPVWRVNEKLLSSVPGVGPIVARSLIAEMPELRLALPQAAVSALGAFGPFPQRRGMRVSGPFCRGVGL